MEDCLSIPCFAQSQNREEVLQDHCCSRVVVISEKQYLHVAGNTIRVSPLPKTETNLDNNFRFNSGDGYNLEEDGKDIIFAAADLRRGFSCMTYNAFKRRVAYAPRNTSPSIFLKSVAGRQILCEIKGGVTIEYQDLCFSRNGTRLAAIGRGMIDANLLVWDLVTNDNGITPVLISTHSFQQSVARCLFDPSNQNSIAILTSDSQVVIRFHLSKFVGTHKVSKIIHHSPSDAMNTKTCVTSISWETEGRLILGLGDGSIIVYQDTILSEFHHIKHEGLGAGAVRGIIICSKYIIIGYEDGKLFWFHRLDDFKKSTLSNSILEADIGGDISLMTNSPDYDLVVAHSTKKGELHSLRIEAEGGKTEHSLKGARYQFPSGVVTGMACVVLTGQVGFSVFVTGSSDGTLKVWKDATRTCRKEMNEPEDMIGFIDVGIPITALEPLIGCPVFAVGFADSSIKFFYIRQKKNTNFDTRINGNIEVELIMIKSEVLNLSPVTHLVFNEKTKKMAAGCFDSGEVFILCTEPNNLHVIGVLETLNKERLESIFWSRSNSYHLFVGASAASLLYFDTTPLCFTPEPLKPIYAQHGLSSLPRGFVTPSTSEIEDTHLLFCCGSSRRLVEFYDIHESPGGCVVARDCKYDGVECSNGSTICVSIHGRIFIGARTGVIKVIEPNGDKFDTRMVSNSHCHPILAICMSSDRSRLYSSSSDGSVFVCRMLDTTHDITISSYDYDYLVSTSRLSTRNHLCFSHTNCFKLPTRSTKMMQVAAIDPCEGDGGRLTWLSKSKDQMLKDLETKSFKIKHDILQSMNDLTKRVQDIIDQHGNRTMDQCDSSDKMLERFTIDISADKQKRIDLESKLICYRDAMKSRMSSDEASVALLSKRYVDTMEMPLEKLCELTDTGTQRLSICSFPIHSLTEKEKRRIYCTRVLRQNEMADMKQSVPAISNTRETDRTNFLLFHHNESETIQEGSVQSDEVEGNHSKFESFGPSGNLLYPVQSLRSNFRRRVQIYLLELASREEAKTLNSEFTMLMKERESFEKILGKVSEKIGIDSKVHLKESRFGLLHVLPTETNSSTRDEYDEKDPGHLQDQKCEDDKEEYFQQQMDEVKRHSSAVDDLAIAFNRKLSSLHETRFGVHQRLLRNDLDIHLIAESIFLSNDSIREAALVPKEICDAQQLYEKTKHDLKIAQNEYKRVQARQQNSAHEIKDMEKNFRSKIQTSSEDPLDQETVNLLYLMYHRRDFGSLESIKERNSRKQKGRKASILSRRSKLGRQSGRDSTSSNKSRPSLVVERKSKDTSSHNFGTSIWGNIELGKEDAEKFNCEHDFVSENDPFLEVNANDENTVSTTGSRRLEVIPTIDDIPEGFSIDMDAWNAMLRLREEKVAKERELAKNTKNLDDMKIILDAQQGEEKACYEAISTLMDKKRKFEIERLDRLQSTDFVVSMNQGQDEVEKDAIATDYSDALFLPTHVIDRANGRILTLAQERLKILHRIKSFRRIINKMKFGHEILTLRNKDAKELLTDYHLLRLNSGLKKILNGEVEDAEKIALKTKAQLSRQKIAHKSKIDKLLREKEVLVKSITKRERENVKLGKQLDVLKERVSTIEKEHKTDVTSVAVADKKMLNITRRSKTVKKIKLQSNEIARLRSELGVLKQKTFPSFSSV